MTPSFIVQPTSAGFCGGEPGAAPRPAGTTQPLKSYPLNSGFQSPDGPAAVSRGAATPPPATRMAPSATMETEARVQRGIGVMRFSIKAGRTQPVRCPRRRREIRGASWRQVSDVGDEHVVDSLNRLVGIALAPAGGF